ncbi:hypothetical protein [Pedobacter frigiditerrae]|uniref:hypothetical protein n=1 Tax=Pedobacter frigiditerrae TaxID=2530452 RepID=UPI002930E725|nr:hypothetical protein [Pedobacter frigiditerrae]
MMQKLCMYVTPLFAILFALSGLGWNHYGLKVKEEEAVLKNMTETSVKKEPQINISGDYIAGNKIIKDKSIHMDKSKTEHNTNSGNNFGNIGGSGNSVTNNITVSGPTHLSDKDKDELLQIVLECYEEIKDAHPEKTYALNVSMSGGSHPYASWVEEFLKSRGFTVSVDGIYQGTFKGIAVGINNGQIVVKVGTSEK